MSESRSAEGGRKRAVVVGGTGFIGGRLAQDLRARGFHVRILVRGRGPGHVLPREGMEIRCGSVLDPEFLRRETRDADLVYSAFGVLGRWGLSPDVYRKTHVQGLRNLIQSCADRPLTRFLHISSAGVLGPLAEGVVADETFPLRPSNAYERSKAEAETLLEEEAARLEIPFTIVRPEFVYGPGDTHVLGLFRAVAARRFVILGSGESTLHPTYVEDLVRGVRLCAENPAAAGETFLITGERALTVREIAETMAQELGVRLPRIRVPSGVAGTLALVFEAAGKVAGFEPPLTRARVKFFTENRAFDWAKARDLLGYRPEVEFREGVRRTVAWYREKGLL